MRPPLTVDVSGPGPSPYPRCHHRPPSEVLGFTSTTMTYSVSFHGSLKRVHQGAMDINTVEAQVCTSICCPSCLPCPRRHQPFHEHVSRCNLIQIINLVTAGTRKKCLSIVFNHQIHVFPSSLVSLVSFNHERNPCTAAAAGASQPMGRQHQPRHALRRVPQLPQARATTQRRHRWKGALAVWHEVPNGALPLS